jgi:hypothetical protein
MDADGRHQGWPERGEVPRSAVVTERLVTARSLTEINMKTITFAGVTYPCPFYNAMPPLTPVEQAELRADIVANGVTCAVIVTDEKEVIDGHNRLEIAAELNLTAVPMTVLSGLTPDQKRLRAENLNLHRRHLTPGQKRDIIAHRLRADPTQSNREIAGVATADHKTVGTVRADLEATGEIPQLPATKGKDGRTRTRRRKLPSGEGRASPSIAHRHRDGEEARDVAPRIANCTPATDAPRWSELAYVAMSIRQLSEDLMRVSKTKVSDRDPAAVLALADRLQRYVNDLRMHAPAPTPERTTA